MINKLVSLADGAIRALWLPGTLLLGAAMTWASLMPPGSAGDPGAWDKPIHLASYAALAFPCAYARPPAMVWWLAGLALWSGGIELVQPALGRGADPADLLANIAGLLTGMGLGLLCAPVARRIRLRA